MRFFLFLLLFNFVQLYNCSKQKNTNSSIINISIDNNIESDSTIIKYYLPYKENLEKSLMNKPIAYSEKTFKKNDGELNSTLSNMFADATYDMSNEIYKSISGENIDIVILNNGGIRSIISKGPISEKTAFELMPFENSIVVLKLKGNSINKMINYLIKVKLQHPIKGLKINLNEDYTIDAVTVGGNKVDEQKIYNVATTDYLLDGGDKMYFLGETIETVDINYKMRDLLIDYFKKIDTLKLEVDNRFTRK
tara:strand:- start:579 stop:1331 length:753 start_codon:yes stop_codon:yes gene_type:complete